VVEYVETNRSKGKGTIDIVAGGMTGKKKSKPAAEIVKPFSEAGATWWAEFEPTLERIRQGPPA